MREQQCDYVLKTAPERGVRMVRLWFTDVLGNLKSFAISQNELENALNDGMTFDGSSIDGFSRVQESTYSPFQIRTRFKFFHLATRMLPKRECSATYTTLMALRSLAIHAKCFDDMLKQHAVRVSRFTLRLDIEFFYFTPPQPGERPTPLDFGGYFDLTTRDVTGDLRKQTIRTLEQIDPG